MRILLVEDEADLAARIAKFLRGLGHTVRWAGDGESASRLLKERPYPIAIIDLVLPKLDGVQLIRQIHQGECKGQPLVIVTTAYPERLPEPYGLVCEVLRKPKELTRLRLKKAIEYCEELLEEQADRERGARVCDRLIAEGELEPKEGLIAVVNIEKRAWRLFGDEQEAIAYAKQHGGKRPYLRYFDSKLCTRLQRMKG